MSQTVHQRRAESCILENCPKPLFGVAQRVCETAIAQAVSLSSLKTAAAIEKAPWQVGPPNAKFKIYFPRVREGAEKPALAHDESEPPQGSETILVVEDDQSLRELTVNLLRDGGYRVIEAKDGEDAGDLRVQKAGFRL